jgi:hypothetical protein
MQDSALIGHSRLLQHVRHFVTQQLQTLPCRGSERAWCKEDLVARGKRARAGRIRQFVRPRVAVNVHHGKVRLERTLQPRPHL